MSTTWTDGLLIQALTEKLGCVTIVWRRTAFNWERFCRGEARFGNQGAPLCVILKDKHYLSLRPPGSNMQLIPKEWLQETPGHFRASLSGAGPSVRSGKLSQGSWCTPSVRSDWSGSRGAILESIATPSVRSAGTYSKKELVKNLDPSGTQKDLDSQNKDNSSCRTPSVFSLCTPSVHSGTKASGSHTNIATPSVHCVTKLRITGKQTACSTSSRPHGPDTQKGSISFLTENNSEPDTKPMSMSSALSILGESPQSFRSESSEGNCGEEVTESLIDKWEVWWTCTCGFQVLKHPDVVGHRERRRLHLYRKHKIPFKDIPDFDEDNKQNGMRLHMPQVADIFLTKYSSCNWENRHDLVYQTTRKFCRWFCNQCNKKFRFTGISTPCDRAPHQSIRPGRNKRKQECSKWWKQATKALADKHAKTKSLLKQQAFINRQRQAWTTQPQPVLSETAKGIPLAPRTEPEVWWKCPYFEFQVKTGDRKRPHAQRLYHLNRAHGLKGKQAHLMKPDDRSNPHRPLALVQSVKNRWEKQLQEFQKLRWPGAHDLRVEPARIKVTNGKSRQYVRTFYECKACLHLVPTNAVPTDTCSATNGKGPSIAKRKQIWTQCRNIASLTTTKWLQDISTWFQKTENPTSAQFGDPSEHPFVY